MKAFLMKVGLSGLVVDMPDGRFKSLEVMFSNAPRQLASGIESTMTVNARVKIIKKTIDVDKTVLLKNVEQRAE